MSDSLHPTGTYVKGDSLAVANTTARAVALTFDGYELRKEIPSEGASYRDLQAKAKELGIPANQSEDDLRVAIAGAMLPSEATVVDEPTDTPED